MKLNGLVSACLLLAPLSLAQNDLFSQLPACTATCLQQTITTSSCDPADFPCLCQDKTFQQAAAACQAQSCTVKETLTATNATLIACGVKPRDQSVKVMAIPASFGSLAILMVILRMIDRLLLRRVRLEWDDLFVIVAVLLASPLNFVCFPMAHFGMGKELWSLTPNDITTTFRLLFIAEVFFMAAEMFVQLSLLAFYLRIFASALFRTIVQLMMGIVLCFGIANTLTMIFQCTPVPFFWNGWSGEHVGHCININLYSWIRAALEIAIDIAIIMLPIPTVLKLQMSWQRRMQIIAVFCVGFLITLVSILRLQSLVQFSKTTNPTYDNAPAVYWSVLECDMFIICACMPAMRNILKFLAPSCFDSTVNGSAEGANRISQRSKHSGSHQYRRDANSREETESDIELVDSPPQRGTYGKGAWRKM